MNSGERAPLLQYTSSRRKYTDYIIGIISFVAFFINMSFFIMAVSNHSMYDGWNNELVSYSGITLKDEGDGCFIPKLTLCNMDNVCDDYKLFRKCGNNETVLEDLYTAYPKGETLESYVNKDQLLIYMTKSEVRKKKDEYIGEVIVWSLLMFSMLLISLLYLVKISIFSQYQEPQTFSQAIDNIINAAYSAPV